MDEKQIAALREAFEQAVRELFPFSYAVHGFELRDDGKYRHGFIREAWTVWLACYQHLAPMVEDGERYRYLQGYVFAGSDAGGVLKFFLPLPMPINNPMRGSVAEHFNDAIDAAREQEKKTC